MLNRREFLTTAAGGFVTLVLTPLVSACGSGSMYDTVTSSNPTTPACDGAGETSTISNGHTHTLCVPLSDLDNPPASGATYTTSVTEGHEHTVTLIQAWLMAIAQGQTVKVTSSTVSVGGLPGHTHDFAVAKAATPAAITPTPSPPVTGPYY